MNKKRPINLDLLQMKFPPMAIVSILHRISGILLFILLPFILYLLAKSLQSAESFATVHLSLMHPLYKVILWAFAAAFLYHLVAGIRHLVMDLGVGEGLGAGRLTAWLVLILTAILALILGIWLW